MAEPKSSDTPIVNEADEARFLIQNPDLPQVDENLPPIDEAPLAGDLPSPMEGEMNDQSYDWNRLFTDQDFFDEIANSKQMREAAEMSLHGDDYVYREAMIDYMAEQEKMPVSEMRKIFDETKDAFASRELGKDFITAKELFMWQRGQFEKVNNKKAAGQAVLEAVLKRSLEDAFYGQQSDHEKLTQQDIATYGKDLLDADEQVAIRKAADQLNAKVRAAQEPFIEDAKWLFNALGMQTGIIGQKPTAPNALMGVGGLGTTVPLSAVQIGAPDAPDIEDAVQRFADLPEDKINKIFDLAAGFATLAKVDKGVIYQLAESVGRMASGTYKSTKGVTLETTLRSARRMAEQGYADDAMPTIGDTGMPAPMRKLTPEEQAQRIKEIDQQLKLIKLERNLRMLAERRIDPIKTVSTWMPEWMEEGIYGAGSTLSYSLIAAIPIVGLPLTALTLYAQGYEELMFEFPDMPPEKAMAVAAVAAPFRAGIERLQFLAVLGKRLPFTSKFLQHLIKPQQRVLTRTLLLGASGYAEQNIQELVENSIQPLVQTLGAALDEDIPDFKWGEKFDNFGKEVLVNMVATFPLSGVGMGFIAANEVRFGEQYLYDKAILERMGFKPDVIESIAAERDAETKAEKFREGFAARDVNDINAANQRIIDDMVAAGVLSESIAMPTIEKQGDEYVVKKFDGSEVIRTTDGELAGYELQRQLLSEEQQSWEALNLMVDAVRKIKAERGLEDQSVIELIESDRLQTMANMTPEQLKLRLDALEKEMGTKLDPADAQIVGMNISEIRDGIFRDVSRIAKSGRPDMPLVVIEESIEGDLKRAWNNGIFSREETLNWVRDYQTAKDDQLLADDFDSLTPEQQQDNLIEAVSSMGVAFFTGNIDRASIPSRLAAFFRRVAVYIQAVLSRALKLREYLESGEMDARFQQFFAESLGVSFDTAVDALTQQAGAELQADASFGIRSTDPYPDRIDDPSTPLTPSEVAEGIESESGTTTEQEIDDDAWDRWADDKSFAVRPVANNIPVVDVKTLKGKKKFIYFSDRMRVGSYRGIDPASGIDIPLQGGPAYPFTKGNFENEAGWAFSDVKMFTRFLQRILKTDGIGIATLYASGNIRGNNTFLEAYFAEVAWAIKSGKITQDLFLAEANKLRESALTTKKLKKKSDWVDLWRVEWKSLDQAKEALAKSTFEVRGSLFFAWTPDKKGSNKGAKIGADKLVAQGFPNLTTMVELMEDPTFAGLDHGTMVAAVQFDKKQKAHSTAQSLKVDEHLSYPIVAKGKGIGYLNKQASALTVLKTKKQGRAALRSAETSMAGVSFAVRSKITPQQDAEYLAAVERGDMETAQRMVDEVANAAGFYGPLYHQTKSTADFKVFNNRVEGGIKGIYAGDIDHMEDAGYGDRELEVFVKITNPLTEQELGFFKGDTGEIATLGNLAESPYDPKWVNRMQKKGYDGILWSGGRGTGQIAVVFDSSQIKLADPVTRDDAGNVIPLSQRFDETRPEITFAVRSKKDSLRVKMTRQALTDAALDQASWKDWYEEHQAVLDDFFGDHAQLFQDILSITSQAASVKANVGLALRAFGLYHRGEPFDGKLRGLEDSTFLPAVIMNLERLREQQQLQGQKIRAYKASNDGKVDEAVIDRHISQLIFGVKSPSKAQFAKAQKILSEIANEIGWTPRQVQAALWAHSIYKSGKTPESYGDYLKKLEAKGTIEQRIGELGQRGAGRNADDRGRGRFAPTGEGQGEGQGVASFAIRSAEFQAGTDGVVASLQGSMPAEQIAEIEARLTEIRQQFEDAVNPSDVALSAEDALNQLKAIAGMFPASVRSEVSFENLAKFKGQTGRANYILDRVAVMARMVERMRNEGMAAQATLDAAMDIFNRATDVDYRRERVAAALEKFKTIRDRFTQAEPMEPLSQVEAVAYLEAIIEMLPPEARGAIGGMRRMAELTTPEARVKYLKDRIARTDEVLEDWLRASYIEEIAKVIERATQTMKDNRVNKSAIGPAAQRAVFYIAKVMDMTPDEVANEDAALQAQMNNPQADAEAISELVENYGLLAQYGALASKSLHDAAALSGAYDQLVAMIQTGRRQWQAQEQQRIEENRQRKEAALIELGQADQVDGATQSQLQTGKEKDDSVWRKVRDFVEGHLAWHEFLEEAFGTKSTTAQHFEREARKATNRYEDIQIAEKFRFRSTMIRQMGIGSEISMRTMAKLNDALSKLAEPRQSKAVLLENRVVTTERVPITTAIDAIYNGKASALGFNTDEVFALNSALRAVPAGSITRRKYIEIDRVKKVGDKVAQRLSELEAIQDILSWGQEDVRVKMERQGFTQDYIDSLNNEFLSFNGKVVMAFLRAEYAKGYAKINPVYRRMFGMDMPRVRNYAPTAYDNAQGDAPVGPDEMSPSVAGMAAGFIKQRVLHNAPIKRQNALAVFMRHVTVQNYWVNFAELVREMRGSIGSTDVIRALRAKRGNRLANNLTKWIRGFDKNGLEQGELPEMMTNLLQAQLSVQAVANLGWSIGTLLKQASAFLGSGIEIGPKAYAAGMARLFRGELSASLPKIWNTDAIQRRVAIGYSPEARAVNQAAGLSPSKLLALAERGMINIAQVDAAFTTVSAAIAFDYHYREALKTMRPDMAERAAMDKMDEVIRRTAQPASFADRSLLEANRNPFVRVLFMFMSEARQKFAIDYLAAKRILRGEEVKKNAGKIAVSWVGMALVTELMNDIFQSIFRGEDDLEDIWEWEDYARAMMLGHLNGMMLAGTVVEGGFNYAFGKHVFSDSENPLMQTMGRATRKNINPLNWEDAGDAVAGIKLWFQVAASMTGSTALAGAAAMTTLAKDAVGLFDRISSDEE
jgi:hypothetical protein